MQKAPPGNPSKWMSRMQFDVAENALDHKASVRKVDTKRCATLQRRMMSKDTSPFPSSRYESAFVLVLPTGSFRSTTVLAPCAENGWKYAQ